MDEFYTGQSVMVLHCTMCFGRNLSVVVHRIGQNIPEDRTECPNCGCIGTSWKRRCWVPDGAIYVYDEIEL